MSSSTSAVQYYQPDMPLLEPISGQLSPGSRIRIFGIVDPDCERFAVNLKLGAEEGDEVALHFNPRFTSSGYSVVVRNTYTSLGWGPEERQPSPSSLVFPFEKGRTYVIEILCELARYRITVDGKLFTTYTHRLPLSHVSHIEILGGTTVCMLEITVPNTKSDCMNNNFGE